ncbi:nitric oxide reductase activation protein NorD [Caldimonas brevitalea]|uniref:von Willebrand factor A n=1 Tax=Caldimonas brevitalea TaxID=413882 RepID=A0A0G3BSA2_9BURK|nr:VWA domain-containing protein [Caldimonas brevitalea]AKJ30883.1 von Willebrand factor A [Caldimonas brevitalea]
MAEAEEVLQDVAKHATVFARDLWRRHRKARPGPAQTALRDVAQRLDLLLCAAFGRSFPLKLAEPPAPASFLTKVFRRGEGPRVEQALPSTDGLSIWLPGALEDQEALSGLEHYRMSALQQAARAVRGSAAAWASLARPTERALFLLHEAHAADAQLLQLLPGTMPVLQRLRGLALRRRPPLDAFPAHRQPIEQALRQLLESDLHGARPRPVDAVVAHVRELAHGLPDVPSGRLLLRDAWTGEFRLASPVAISSLSGGEPPDSNAEPPRSARLGRRPQVREAAEDEDDQQPGAWMVQTSQPQEQAEDPVGLQRPTDRDASTAAEELADALSELPEARLVSTPGRAKEILLSEDPPEPRAKQAPLPSPAAAETQLRYPEWDYRVQAYHEDSVTVHVGEAPEGPQAWVDERLKTSRAMLDLVRRRFEMLKAQRVRLRKQWEGDEVDLDAYIEAHADFRAGRPMAQALYQSWRQARRDMAILILTDVSGSTDGWISAHQRVVDVEREALLLVAIALQGMAEPCALQAFSGEGPRGVRVLSLKRFDEPFSDRIARRIASLEPEHYTRAGAAIRHAAATLMREPARHRLLLLLSDGKPNDIDDYEGRYGVEDMRQAVTEAKLQGIHPFCLTVDRQAARYLPGIFGPHHYALLPRPDLLPTVLLEWMKRMARA